MGILAEWGQRIREFTKDGIVRTWWPVHYPVAVNVVMIGGWWLSLGVHIDIIHVRIDLHVLWFEISVMRPADGEDYRAKEIEYGVVMNRG